MMLRAVVVFAVLSSSSLACTFKPSSFNNAGMVVRLTKPAAVVLNQQTAQVIQAAFRHATYPNISGEKSMSFFGKVAYGLTNIHIDDLSIEKSDAFFTDDTITIEIQNVSAFFKGTLSYGYVGAWWLRLIHLIDFEIESSIDLQINTRLSCEKENEKVAADSSDCYLTFHKLILHLQGDKDPGWIKQLFTNFISFTLKLVLKSQVCKEINFLTQVLAEFLQGVGGELISVVGGPVVILEDLPPGESFVRYGNIGVDVSLASPPVIQAKYIETQHKGLLMYKNYSDSFHESVFAPSLLSESKMVSFWFSEHVLSSVIWAAFLDDRLMLTITGEELQEMFKNEELESDQEIVQKIFQGASYNDSLAKVWSLSPPQIILQPKGTVVKSSVAVELSVSSRDTETPLVIYFEKDVTVTIQTSYVQKQLVLHPTEAVIEPKTMRCSFDIAVNDDALSHFLEKTITVAGIPQVISKIEPALTSLMNSRGLDLFDIIEPEIITRNGYFIIQMDFDFPHYLLHGFLKRILL